MSNELPTPGRKGSATDHLANERTFLAWIRTGVGIMAFGFVVVKFSLFVRQLSLALGEPVPQPQRGYTAILGISLVVVGALCNVFAWLQYRHTTRRLNEGNYTSSSPLTGLIMIILSLMSILLIGYLVITT